MGAALYIKAEREVDGLEVQVDGRALARIDEPEELAERAGVAWLLDFFALGPDDALASLIADPDGPEIGDGGEDPQGEAEGDPDDPGGKPAEEWFEASEGLASVRGLLAYLEAHPGDLPEEAEVVEDLRRFEAVLAALDGAAVRWHLAVDF